MRAYYFDNVPGDQRHHHDSGRPVDLEYLDKLGLKLLTIPLDTPGGWEAEIDRLAEQRGAPIRDIMNITKEGLGDRFEYMLGKFFGEHMHDDEEIRYIISGAGFWDIRDHPTDDWIRIQVLPGDFVIIPPGIYHRFTLDESNEIEAVRLTTPEKAKYESQARGSETDDSASRCRYLDSRVVNEALPDIV